MVKSPLGIIYESVDKFNNLNHLWDGNDIFDIIHVRFRSIFRFVRIRFKWIIHDLDIYVYWVRVCNEWQCEWKVEKCCNSSLINHHVLFWLIYWLDQFRCYDIRIHENSYLTHYIFSSLLYTQKYYFYVLNEESIPYKEKWTNKKLQKRTFQIKKASNLDPCIRGNGQFDKKFRAATVIKLLFP